jgi:Aromatic-ring-opening dioxygenase LigAB, LigA subunit
LSVYTVQEIAWRALHDDAFRERLLEAPEEALREEELEPAERAALLTGDVAALHMMGAHEYLLCHFAAVGAFGLDRPTFSERIRTSSR